MESGAAVDERPCHFMQPFVRHDGAVFPCCRTWGQEQRKIGDLNDPGLVDKLLAYAVPCSCYGYKLRPWGEGDRRALKVLNIEFPMTCNARCAMCCVGAPFKQHESRAYDYEGVWRLIERLRPDRITSQGGEVLAQPETLAFLARVRERYPEISMHVITNGSFDTKKAALCSQVFDTMTVSMVGFQELTYKAIMGLQVERTKAFVRFMLDNSKVEVSLKYLCTPLNVHEIGAFIDWAVPVGPECLHIVNADLVQYVNTTTEIPYWAQIIQRSKVAMTNALVRHKKVLNERNIGIFVDETILKLFELPFDGFEKAGFQTIQRWY